MCKDKNTHPGALGAQSGQLPEIKLRRGAGKGTATGGHPGANPEGKAHAVAELMCKGAGKEKTGPGAEAGAGHRETHIQTGWVACVTYTVLAGPKLGPALSIVLLSLLMIVRSMANN